MTNSVLFKQMQEKWQDVPVRSKSGQISSETLLKMTDNALLSFWENNRREYCEGEGFEIRGWYQVLYRDFCFGKKILDVGCGLAFDSLSFLTDGAAHVTFCDIVESNVETVRRLCRIKGLETKAEFKHIEEINDFCEFRKDYDVVLAIGSLHHATPEILRAEIPLIIDCLKHDGRWLQLAYPRERWAREGAPPFDQWGEKTNSGTPWTEWYDLEKLLNLLGKDRFRPVFSTNFHNDDFVWFDLQKF